MLFMQLTPYKHVVNYTLYALSMLPSPVLSRKKPVLIAYFFNNFIRHKLIPMPWQPGYLLDIYILILYSVYFLFIFYHVLNNSLHIFTVPFHT